MSAIELIREYYTDGACSTKTKKGGWAAITLGLEYDLLTDKTLQTINGEFGYEEDTTNNRMEMKAILAVCDIAYRNYEIQYLIKSDSNYCVQMINSWMWIWAKNDWVNSKGKVVENLDLVQDIYSYFSNGFVMPNSLKMPFNISIEHIYGHTGILGNELADAIASNNKIKYERLLKEYNLTDRTGFLEK